MLKHRVTDVYKDNKKLFTTNTYITTDDRLNFLSDDLPTFDLITKYDYGAREFLVNFLDETELDYILNDIHEAIYMNLLKNLRKYMLLYASDAEGALISPSGDYKITRQYGEEEKHFNYGARSAQDAFSQKEVTNQYGQKQNTNQYGQKQTTDVLGQGQQTVTTAPRSTDSQDQRTTFDSTTDYDTTHNLTSTIQTVDTVADATRTNTSTEAQHSDTLTEGQHTDTSTEGSHNVTKTEQAHSDGVVYEEHTDNVYGYKGNPSKNIEAFRKYVDDNTIKTIVAECLNEVTYSIYLYTGQM